MNTPYEAIRVIEFNGVRAYNPGDLVAAPAVDGPDAWLKLGTDVAVREGHKPDRPADDADVSLWAAYAIGQGADAAKVKDMSRPALIKAYGGNAQ